MRWKRLSGRGGHWTNPTDFPSGVWRRKSADVMACSWNWTNVVAINIISWSTSSVSQSSVHSSFWINADKTGWNALVSTSKWFGNAYQVSEYLSWNSFPFNAIRISFKLSYQVFFGFCLKMKYLKPKQSDTKSNVNSLTCRKCVTFMAFIWHFLYTRLQIGCTKMPIAALSNLVLIYLK